MVDLGKRDIDILRENIGNGLSPGEPTPPKVANIRPGDSNFSNVNMEKSGAMSIDMDNDSLFDNDDDTDSEYGDVVAPSQKRKRRTNNSFAVDLDDASSDIRVPPAPKRIQFSPNEAVIIGVWRDSPPSDPSKKHAVYAFIDSGDSLRRKVYPETREGDSFPEGYPTGTGRSFVPPESVILDPHLSSLSRQELKEYVRIRLLSHRQSESPEARAKAEALAVQEARQITANNEILQASGSVANSPSTSTRLAKPSTPSASKSGIPNGVFLGFWKNSDAKKDVDKHAVFGVADGNRLRVKVIKFTRDGRPYQGNFPTNPGSNWVPFDDVIREPVLAKLKRLEVIEYVRILQNEKALEQSDSDRLKVDLNAAEKATETLSVKARNNSTTVEKLDAETEASRKAHNESRAAMKARDGIAVKGWAYDTPKAKDTEDNLNTREVKDRQAEASPIGATQPTKIRESEVIRPKGSPSVAKVLEKQRLESKTNVPDVAAVPLNTDNSEGKAKAIRSSKADSDARAEKLRKIREAAVAKFKDSAKETEVAKQTAAEKETSSVRGKEGVKEVLKDVLKEKSTDESRQGQIKTDREAARDSELAKREEVSKQRESKRLRQAAIEKAEAEERQAREKVKESRGKEAKEREAVRVRSEMEKAKADAIEAVTNEFFSPDPSKDPARVVSYNNVRYVRKETGPFAGKLVGEKRELLTIDGEDYVEYRILMRTEF